MCVAVMVKRGNDRMLCESVKEPVSDEKAIWQAITEVCHPMQINKITELVLASRVKASQNPT